MKKPATKVLLLGHPMVATPMTLAGGVTIFAALQMGDVFILLITLPMMMAVLAASQQAATYRAWVREWEAMEPGGPRRRKGLLHWLVFIATVVGSLVLMGSDRGTQHQAAAVVGMLLGCLVVVVGIGAAIGAITRRLKGRAGAFAVKVVARPTVTVPSLKDAYRALPPYCQALLGGPQ